MRMVTLYQPQHSHSEGLHRRNSGILLHFTCQRRGGFTLIEMMVVVLIIAILSSITAVAVNSAKEKARQTACMSNLRQLGTAIVTYRAGQGTWANASVVPTKRAEYTKISGNSRQSKQ